jgi:hypothetical protein
MTSGKEDGSNAAAQIPSRHLAALILLLYIYN